MKCIIDMGHLPDRRLEIGMQIQTHSQIDRGTQSAGFIDMRAADRHTEDIGCQLQGTIALRTSTGYAYLRDGHTAALAGSFCTFTQGIGEPFQDGAVEMSTGMHAAKTDGSAFGFGTRRFQPRCPVGLEHKTHRAGWNRADQVVE